MKDRLTFEGGEFICKAYAELNICCRSTEKGAW